MAVYRSPFSKSGDSGDTGPQTKVDLSKAFNPTSLPAAVSADGKKSNASEENYKLDKAYQTARGKILAGSTSQKEKEKALKRLEAVYRAGAYKSPSFVGDISSGIGGVVGASGKAVGKVFDFTQWISRGIQSGIKEIADTVEYAAAGVPVLNKVISDNARMGSWKEWEQQRDNKDWKAVQTGVKWLDSTVDFVNDVAFDPTTYVGVGPLNYVGKAGRAALTTRFATAEMRAKYPQIILNDVMRYGAGAIPREVLQAEGIEYGMRFAGKVVPQTDTIANVFSGKRGIMSNIRASAGDIVSGTKTGAALRNKVAPASRAGLTAINAGRKQGATDDEIIKNIADYTSAKYAKGAKSEFYDKMLKRLMPQLEIARQNGWEGTFDYGGKTYSFTDLLEDPVARQAAPKEIKDVADAIKAWQDEVYNEVNSIYRKFNLEYSGSIKDMGFVDDYVHHRITAEALDAMRSTRWKNFFRDDDLAAFELAKTTGAMMHRRLRADGKTTFMGELLKTGSIREINEIFARKIGVQDAKFFSDDIASVMESYAYSMSNARAREAYIRRLFDFGGDVARVVNQKAIPDRALVRKLGLAYGKVQQARAKMAAAVGAERKEAVKDIGQIIRMVERTLDGQAGKVARVDARIGVVEAELREAERLLLEATEEAARVSAKERGVFVDVHKNILREIDRLKKAIEGDQITEQVALDEIRKLYVQTFPDAKRIPRNPQKALNAVKRAKGIGDQEELRELVKRRDALSRQISDGDYGDEGQLNDLLDLEVQLNEKIDAFTALSDAKAVADYAEDGVLYGSWDDLSPRTYNPETDPRPFRVMDTRPIIKAGDEITTDEIAAARNAFKETESSVVVHAIDPEDMVDLREPETWMSFWDAEDGPLGQALVNSLGQFGVDTTVLREGWEQVVKEGIIDPMFAQVYPEFAELMARSADIKAGVFEFGVIPDDEIVERIDTFREAMLRVLYANDIVDIPNLEDEVFNVFMRQMVVESGNNMPVMLPSRVLYGVDNPMADGAYSVILPDSYNYGGRFAPDELIGKPNSPVRFAKDDELVADIMDDRLLASEMSVLDEMDVLSAQRADLEERVAMKEVLQDEVRKLGSQIGGKRAAASRRIKAIEKAFDDYAKTGRFRVTIGGKRVEMTREQALEELGKRESKVIAEELKMEEALARKTDRALRSPQERVRNKQARLATLFNSKEELARWTDETGTALEEEIRLLQEEITTNAPRGYAGSVSRAWSERVKVRLANIEKLADDPRPEIKAWARVVKQMHAHEAALAKLDMFDIPTAEAAFQAAKAGVYGGKMVDDIIDGWKVIQGMGVQVPPDMYDIMFPAVQKLKEKPQLDALWNVFRRTHEAFKIYATLTPGFSVRNAMSATFMNYVAGVSTKNMTDGIKAVIAYQRYGPDEWLAKSGIPQNMWDLYREAMRATKATGRGLGTELSGPSVRGKFGELVLNNKAVRGEGAWALLGGRRTNDFVELSVRFPMALDSLLRGQNYDEAIYRISRYHFDYDDVSQLDEFAKRFVPFWIWTTRNIPLQMTEQILRPSTYSVYNNLRERNKVAETVIMPTWLAAMTPMSGPGDWLIAPDLPHIRLEQQAQAFTDPKRLVGQMYPTIKLPIELMLADKQLAMDVPFSDKYEKARGLDALVAKVGEIAGRDYVSRRDPNTGELTVNPRISYILGNLMPTVAQAQRLSGGALGGKENYKDRQMSSILNYFGVPVKEPEAYERGELIGRQFKVADLLAELAKQGQIPKGD